MAIYVTVNGRGLYNVVLFLLFMRKRLVTRLAIIITSGMKLARPFIITLCEWLAKHHIHSTAIATTTVYYNYIHVGLFAIATCTEHLVWITRIHALSVTASFLRSSCRGQPQSRNNYRNCSCLHHKCSVHHYSNMFNLL